MASASEAGHADRQTFPQRTLFRAPSGRDLEWVCGCLDPRAALAKARPALGFFAPLARPAIRNNALHLFLSNSQTSDPNSTGD